MSTRSRSGRDLRGLTSVNPAFEALEPRRLLAAAGANVGTPFHDVVLAWNKVMLDANAADHALASPDQGGPTKTSRAFAMVSTAVFDAVNSINHHYEPYLLELNGYAMADVRAAVSVAAHDTLVALYPQQQARLDAELDRWLTAIPNNAREQKGIELGRRMAETCLADRLGDGSEVMVMHEPVNAPGHHQPDPDHPGQGFLGPVWGEVTPFVIDDMASFRSPAPPALGSAEYAAAYNEVKALGGDGINTPTIRTADQANIGLYWAYDGTPGLGTPPRLYNQVLVAIAGQKRTTLEQNARLLALGNLAMADAGVQCWDSKYFHDLWRPVIGIRGGDVDGNDATTADPTWTPLGAPYSNGDGTHQNFTPPFPAYASGHATFGAAAFTAAANFFGTSRIRFSFVSDELNGITTDNTGAVRPRVPRTFASLDQAIEENARSRIYLGIHWAFDATEGVRAGRAIGDFVTSNALLPRHGGHGPHDATLAEPTLEPQAPDRFELAELFSEAALV